MNTILKYLLIRNRKDLLSEGIDILACSCFIQLSPHGNRMQCCLFFNPSHRLHLFLFPSFSYLYLFLTLSLKFSRTTVVSVCSLTTYGLFDFFLSATQKTHQNMFIIISIVFRAGCLFLLSDPVFQIFIFS